MLTAPRAPPRPTAGAWRVPAALFVFTYLVYAVSPVRVQSDSAWHIPTAASILHEGNANLDEFRPTLATYEQHGTTEAGGHLYLDYPMGAVVASLPFLMVGDSVMGLLEPVFQRLGAPGEKALRWRQRFHQTGALELSSFVLTEQRISGVYVAGAVVLVFLAARRRMALFPAGALALLFAFGTSAYSTASRVLWQHSPSLFLVALVVFLLTRAQQDRRSIFVLGLTVAAAYACRPTNALTVMGVSLLMLVRWRRLLPLYLLGAAVVAVPLLAFDFSAFHAAFSPYGAQKLPLLAKTFWEALAGTLVSPNRGLFVYTPILIFSILQIVRKAWERAMTPEELTFVGILVGHWLLIADFPGGWWGGYCFGPRYFTDVLPYFFWFLMPVVAKIAGYGRQRPGLALAFGLCALVSLGIHTRGATAIAADRWNGGPPSVDRVPARVWDWRDLQVLRH